MGILSGLLGNASEIDIRSVETELERILVPGERIERAFLRINGLSLSTNRE